MIVGMFIGAHRHLNNLQTKTLINLYFNCNTLSGNSKPQLVK